MNLIKLSTILYPSLPGPGYRKIPGSRMSGRLVLDVPLTPKYFSEAAKNRVIVLFESILAVVLIAVCYFILKDFGVF